MGRCPILLLLLALLELAVFLPPPVFAQETAQPLVEGEELRAAHARGMAGYYKALKDARAAGKTLSNEEREQLRAQSLEELREAQSALVRARSAKGASGASGARKHRRESEAGAVESGSAETVEFGKPK